MAKQEEGAPARTIEESIADATPETAGTDPVTDESKPIEPAKAETQATPRMIQKKYVFEYEYEILSGVKLERTITASVEADTESEAIQLASLAAVKLCNAGEYPRYTGRFRKIEHIPFA